jgi:outer membrane protein assembly factor BamA
VAASGPFLGYQWLRDDFIKVRYYERFSRYEDYNLGTNISTRVQASTESLGGTDRELICLLQASKGFRYGPYGTVFGQFQLESAVGAIGRAAVQAGLKSYYTAWPQQTFVMQLVAGRTINEGSTKRFTLGGGDGLYGFDSRSFDGPNLFQANIEDRYHFNKELWHSITLGFAGFVDFGNAWGGTTTEPETICRRDPFSMQVKCSTVQGARTNSFGNFKADIGFAILADISPASGLGLVRINIAYPINGTKYDQPTFLISIGNIGF